MDERALSRPRLKRCAWGPSVLPLVMAMVVMVAGGCGTSPSGTSAATVDPSKTVPPPPATVPFAPTGPVAAGPSTVAQTLQPSASEPCGTAPSPPAYRHVVWIVMENRGLGDVVGSPSAPYLDSLARSCGLATNYAGVSHPSLPNYIAMTSGSPHDVSDDLGPASHPLSGPSIFSLLGRDWSSQQESMPVPCDKASGGEYAVKHNPAAYYTGIGPACAGRDVPLGQSPDLTASFTLITPNLCHDMHDCSTATGDTWLATELPLIFGSPEYRAGQTTVFVIWDEDDSGGTLVPAYVVAPSVRPGTRSAEAFTHYSLLRTTEELLGLSPLLGAAASASSMAPAFNL